ncbi:hypothetical protein Sango_0694300 [Sesamum angolense]|uniref:Uncharacterized protein n=1 Tax=Sesamum angolense TaxID=2727404 RepID=A0AAE1X1X4_9LAMI|nr:hypothetical protein Sango_0694300 [Sesamum angolense]
MTRPALNPSHLLNHLQAILDSDPHIMINPPPAYLFASDELGFIHPSQFTALNEELHSSSEPASLLPAEISKSNPHVARSQVKKDETLDVNSLKSSVSFVDIVDTQVMKHSRALVLLSCDFGTAWNSRKLIVSKNLVLSVLMDELRLSALVLSCSPKSERAWSHRRWVIKMMAANFSNLQDIVEKESELVKILAESSKMNYRAWNHRCWLVSYMSDSPLLQMIENLRHNNEPGGLSGAEFHQVWKQMSMFGVELQRSPQYEMLKQLVSDIGKSFLWDSMIASCTSMWYFLWKCKKVKNNIRCLPSVRLPPFGFSFFLVRAAIVLVPPYSTAHYSLGIESEVEVLLQHVQKNRVMPLPG